MALGFSRCVMPKTVEAKIENSKAALKCESVSIKIFFLRSAFVFLRGRWSYDFFPIAMWYASATQIKFSSPATMMYLVP